MTQLERKEKIDQNNKTIQTILNPSQFTLNNTVRALLEENALLQKECEHSFVDGYCEYCYLEEPVNE
jgi:hypothetical protein